jgi:hypothetical protein
LPKPSTEVTTAAKRVPPGTWVCVNVVAVGSSMTTARFCEGMADTPCPDGSTHSRSCRAGDAHDPLCEGAVHRANPMRSASCCGGVHETSSKLLPGEAETCEGGAGATRSVMAVHWYTLPMRLSLEVTARKKT